MAFLKRVSVPVQSASAADNCDKYAGEGLTATVSKL